MFVTIVVLILYAYGGNIRKRRSVGLSIQAKAAAISVCYISIGRIIIFICLAIGAIHVRDKHLDPQVNSIYHSGTIGQINDILYNIPVTLLVFDCAALVACIIIIGCGANLRRVRICGYIIKDFHYYFLVLTVIPLIFSAYSHAPYIIMAYVSDANYASSIFIYYVIVLFVEFGVLEYTFCICFSKSRRSIICGLLLAILLSVVINTLMTTIFVFFFFVPIKYAHT